MRDLKQTSMPNYVRLIRINYRYRLKDKGYGLREDASTDCSVYNENLTVWIALQKRHFIQRRCSSARPHVIYNPAYSRRSEQSVWATSTEKQLKDIYLIDSRSVWIKKNCTWCVGENIICRLVVKIRLKLQTRCWFQTFSPIRINICTRKSEEVESSTTRIYFH